MSNDVEISEDDWAAAMAEQVSLDHPTRRSQDVLSSVEVEYLIKGVTGETDITQPHTKVDMVAEWIRKELHLVEIGIASLESRRNTLQQVLDLL